ncbi:hypothetical protein V2J09_016387 [Rumex salicifolius]
MSNQNTSLRSREVKHLKLQIFSDNPRRTLHGIADFLSLARYNRISEIISSVGMETRPSISAVETLAVKLIDDLRSGFTDTQREAASQLRKLTRNNTENRIVIGSCGAIPVLVSMLYCPDSESQEHAVTALLNLSITVNTNKTAIVDSGAIQAFIHVLKTGSPEAKENTAAAIYSLAKDKEYSVLIGSSGAIPPLVELLKDGSVWGKKDAATALFEMSTSTENKTRIIKAGAVEILVDLMDPAVGLPDKAVAALLANLASTGQGRAAIAQAGGIPVLVEVVELGSSKGKDFAVSALCHLCSNSNRFCNMLLSEDAVPPLMALMRSAKPRTKEKVHKILKHLRVYRHSNSGRE